VKGKKRGGKRTSRRKIVSVSDLATLNPSNLASLICRKSWSSSTHYGIKLTAVADKLLLSAAYGIR
jgi:hypothetical protein